MRGDRAAAGSWKIICAARRNALRSRPRKPVMSAPSKRKLPAVGGTSPNAARISEVLPDPLSPTTPSVSPGASAKDTDRTAGTEP